MHVIPLQDGGAQLRLTKDELERLIGHSFPALLQLQDKARVHLFHAECSRICAEDAKAASS